MTNEQNQQFKLPRIVAINGDICSGSSSVGKAVAKRLHYTHLGAGDIYRMIKAYEPDIDSKLLSQMIDKQFKFAFESGRRLVLEGRLVGVQAERYADVLPVLCVVRSEIATSRFMTREGLKSLLDAQKMLDTRKKQDNLLMVKTWNMTMEQLLDPNHYRFRIDTSDLTPYQAALEVISKIYAGNLNELAPDTARV